MGTTGEDGRSLLRLVPRPSRGEAAAALAVLVAVVGYALTDTYVVERVCYDGILLGAAVVA